MASAIPFSLRTGLPILALVVLLAQSVATSEGYFTHISVMTLKVFSCTTGFP